MEKLVLKILNDKIKNGCACGTIIISIENGIGSQSSNSDQGYCINFALIPIRKHKSISMTLYPSISKIIEKT